ncbi:hypothetical protein BKA70DRAFT_1228088 [Coprinopsis sp. MPI-PUGE-AT-0042]|nr:hypothetical protein BKA70DRAFT_1228088 [Coprinopsis sp. MPI-PUGE-AT-0042]
MPNLSKTLLPRLSQNSQPRLGYKVSSLWVVEGWRICMRRRRPARNVPDKKVFKLAHVRSIVTHVLLPFSISTPGESVIPLTPGPINVMAPVTTSAGILTYARPYAQSKEFMTMLVLDGSVWSSHKYTHERKGEDGALQRSRKKSSCVLSADSSQRCKAEREVAEYEVQMAPAWNIGEQVHDFRLLINQTLTFLAEEHVLLTVAYDIPG